MAVRMLSLDDLDDSDSDISIQMVHHQYVLPAVEKPTTFSKELWDRLEKFKNRFPSILPVKAVTKLVDYNQFNQLMSLCIFLNTIALALDHHGISKC